MEAVGEQVRREQKRGRSRGEEPGGRSRGEGPGEESRGEEQGESHVTLYLYAVFCRS